TTPPPTHFDWSDITAPIARVHEKIMGLNNARGDTQAAQIYEWSALGQQLFSQISKIRNLYAE
ncbi:MAG: hypothetical protein AAFV88_26265, partial [Planctomycetota bacterium]